MERPASQQTAWSNLDQALDSLTEVSTTILGGAISVEKRLLRQRIKGSLEEQSFGGALLSKKEDRLPLLEEVEQRVRDSIGRIREAYFILENIEKELD